MIINIYVEDASDLDNVKNKIWKTVEALVLAAHDLNREDKQEINRRLEGLGALVENRKDDSRQVINFIRAKAERVEAND